MVTRSQTSLRNSVLNFRRYASYASPNFSRYLSIQTSMSARTLLAHCAELLLLSNAGTVNSATPEKSKFLNATRAPPANFLSSLPTRSNISLNQQMTKPHCSTYHAGSSGPAMSGAGASRTRRTSSGISALFLVKIFWEPWPLFGLVAGADPLPPPATCRGGDLLASPSCPL